MSGLAPSLNEVAATFENALFTLYGQHRLSLLHYVIAKQRSMVDVVAVDIDSSVEAAVYVAEYT